MNHNRGAEANQGLVGMQNGQQIDDDVNRVLNGIPLENNHGDSDEEDEGNGVVPKPMGAYDKGRMVLGATEKAWALQIKAAVDSHPEIDTISDFMCAQFAIVTLGQQLHLGQPPTIDPPLDEILERIQGLQSLREEFSILESYQQGCQVMRKIVCDLLPGWFIAMEYLPEKGKYLRVVGLTSFDMSLFSHPEKVRLWHAAIYYINHCHTPDLEAARQGFVQCIECQGYEWRNPNMFHIKAFQEAAPSFVLYPINCSQSVHYNTGMFVKLLATMARRLLPKRMTDSFEFEASGCGEGDTGHNSTLMDIFAQPTIEDANERLCIRLEDALQRRYDNEAKFSLDK